MRVARVAREGLVAAVAGQRDRHVTAGHLRQQVRRERRRIGERLAVGVHQLGQQLGGVRAQHVLVVIGLVQARDLARVGHLGEVLLVEADRERLDRLRAHLAHDRDDRGRIDPARQERAQRDVRDQAHLHRLEQVVAQLLDEVFRRPLPRREAQLPVAFLRQLPVLEHGDAAGAELPHARDGGELGRHEAQRQVGVDRLRVGAALDVAVGEQRLQLRRERQPALADVKVERLLAQSIAPQHQPPPGRVPDREREHAAHLADERHPVQAVQLQQHLRVGTRPQDHARVAQLRGQLAEVVDLAVEHQHDLPVAAQHRLVRARRQVDDRQARVAQRGEAAAVNAGGVRAAVGERVRHRANQRVRVTRAAARIGAGDVARYAAHGITTTRFTAVTLASNFPGNLVLCRPATDDETLIWPANPT